MTASGRYAVHEGVLRRVVGTAESSVVLLVHEDESGRDDWWGLLRRDRLPGGEPVVVVERAALDRLYDRTVDGSLAAGTGRGTARVMADDGDEVLVSFIGPPATARELGLTGDQYDGWEGRVPRALVTDVREAEHDLPLVKEPSQ